MTADDAADLAAAVLWMFAELDRAEPWRRDALCREPDYPVALFFPARGDDLSGARAVCSRCLVRDECATFAVSDRWARMTGVWGGLTTTQRRRRRDARLTSV